MATPEEKIQAAQELLNRGRITQAQFQRVQAKFTPKPEPDLTEAEFIEQFGDIPDVEGRIIPESRQRRVEPDRGLGEQLLGAGEAALTTVTGATGGLAGNLVGTLKGLAEEIVAGNFGSQEAANRILQEGQRLGAALTFMPRTEAGQEIVEGIGEVGEQLAPLAGLSAPISQIGQTARLAAPQVRQAAQQVAQVAAKPAAQATALFKTQSPTKQRIAQLLQEGRGSAQAAKFEIDPSFKVAESINKGLPRVRTDKAAVNAIRQGFDEGTVATVKTAAPADKLAMKRMLEILKRGADEPVFRAKNRPLDVVGKRVVDSLNEVRRANRKAGRDIDIASQALKGQDIDSIPIGQRFADNLKRSGVSINDDLTLNFKGSDFEGLANIENTLNRVFDRLSKGGKPDAFDLHRAKRFIDEQVSYGKAGEGLTAKSQRILESLRKDIDQTLDGKFKDYDKANTIYSETVKAIDSVQRLAGQRVDLSAPNLDKRLGTLMRRVLSNAQSRVDVAEVVNQLEALSNKYPSLSLLEGQARKGPKPSIDRLIIFADELDSRFKPVARTSLQGEVEKVAGRGAQLAADPVATTIGAAARGIDKIRGITDEKAIQAMLDLLEK